MKTEIENILLSVLPKQAFINVKEIKSCFGDEEIMIFFAAKDYDINNVSGQKPQAVSLLLDIKTLELRPQSFGCCGGHCIDRKPNLELQEEKYLHMKSIRIPFRTPKPIKEKVLNCIKTFAENWLKLLRENKDVLMYQNIVNYNELLS